VEQCRAALKRCPPDHSDRSNFLSNLANSLGDRFTQRGVPSDLDECIELLRAALLLCPPGHSHRSESLNNLATSLRDRFTQRAIPSDLDETFSLNRDNLSQILHAPLIPPLCPPDHLLRSTSLNNLALSLKDRFAQRGVPSDLNECIELNRAALLLFPPDHSDRSSSLNNLALSLGERFTQRGVPSDLDECIELLRAALLLCPPGHSDRSTSLNNLAASLRDRFAQRGVPSDLDECIELLRAALLLCPPGHSLRLSSLNNLALSLRDRFAQRGIPSDLDECIELLRAALLLCPPGHSLRSTSLINLATSLRDRFTQRAIPSDLDETFSLFLQLSHISHAVSRMDLAAAKSWVTSAEKINHGSALVAYQTALEFLDHHVTLLSSSSRHFDVVSMATSSLAVDAFSCGIRHGALTTAVELVEQGRAVFWAHLARFRTTIDELSMARHTGATLAEEFKQLSFRLRNAFDQSTAGQSLEIRQLTMQWDDVVSRIRMLPDFSRF
ncbi:hypothetical protein P692DRAFT_201661222, partial [Suillus brevipes Sb2]